MKKLAAAICLLLTLSGCGQGEMNRCLALRSRILRGKSVTFQVQLTADYGEECHIFSMDCTGHEDGSVSFTITQPETLADICGSVSGSGGRLVFEETVLALPMLAEGVPSPVSAPWLFYDTLRSGYMRFAGKQGEGITLTADNRYEDNALRLEIVLNGEDTPVSCEIFQEERRIAALSIEDFEIHTD